MSPTPSKSAAPKKPADPEAALAAKVLKAKNPTEVMRKEKVDADRLWGWARDGHLPFDSAALRLLTQHSLGAAVDTLVAVAKRLPDDSLRYQGLADALEDSYRKAPEHWESCLSDLSEGARELLVRPRVQAGVDVEGALRERVLERYAGFVAGDPHQFYVSLIRYVSPLEGRDSFLERVRRLHTPEREGGRRPTNDLLTALSNAPWSVFGAVIDRHPYLIGDEALASLIEARGDSAADVYATFVRHRNRLYADHAWLILRLAAARGEVPPEVELETIDGNAPSTVRNAAALDALPPDRRKMYISQLKASVRTAQASELLQDPSLDEELVNELVELAQEHNPAASPGDPDRYEIHSRLADFVVARRHGVALMTRAYERYLPTAKDAMQARYVRWAIRRASFRAMEGETHRPVEYLAPDEDIAWVYDPVFVNGGTDMWRTMRPDELTRLYELWAAEDWDGTLDLKGLAEAAGRKHVVPPIEERSADEIARLLSRTSGVRLGLGERTNKTVTRALACLDAAQHPYAAELRKRL
jgi:hypothetical protein